MGIKDDLVKDTRKIFADHWSVSEGEKVPDPEDLLLGANDARRFERATVLYADLSGSTKLVNSRDWWFAAEIYKTFLNCAGKLVRASGGVITSYDGDRIMAVYIGGLQTTSAARCALKINWAVRNIINPELASQYPTADYTVRQVVGIDTCELRTARIGVRGGNDLVWVGRAANYAAKLTELSEAPTWITKEAYDWLSKPLKVNGEPQKNMWQKRLWTSMNNHEIYSSSWQWHVDRD